MTGLEAVSNPPVESGSRQEAAAPTGQEGASNPYVGPRPFYTREGGRFFGRDDEASRLLYMVTAEHLVLFYAQSGAGKSSLINARLVPGLQKEPQNCIVLPTGRVSGQRETTGQVENPFVYNLLLSLQSKSIPSTINADALAHTTLPEYLAQLPNQDSGEVQPLVLVIDQFEEIFTTHPGEWRKREDFFVQLRQAQENDPLLWVVLAMREDYIARLDPYAHLLSERPLARFYMERLGRGAALVAVRKPAEGVHPFAPGVAEELVDNLARLQPGEATGDPLENLLGQYVEPVQLQVVCHQLWEQLTNKPAGSQITREDLKRLAGGDDLAKFISGALSGFYEQAISSVMEAMQSIPERQRVTERQLRDWFSTQLITSAKTCAPVFRGPGTTAGMPNRIVELLIDKFIIRAENRGANIWYVLSHERFVTPVLDANLAWYQRNPHPILADVEAWLKSGKDPAKLYEGRQLQAALLQLHDPHSDLSEAEQQFIRASQFAADQQQASRNRRLVIIFLLLALVFAALATFAFYQMGEAQKQRGAYQSASVRAQQQAEEANRARATAQAAKDLEALQRHTAEAASVQAQLQAMEADQARATAQAAKDLEALQRQTAEAASIQAQLQAVAADQARATAQAASILAQSSRLASLSDYFRDTQPDLSLLLAVNSLKMSNNSQESRRALLNSIQNKLTNRVTRAGQPWYLDYRPYSVAFSPDDSQVAVGALGHVRLWNAATGEEVTNLPPGFDGNIAMYTVAFASTGSILARGGGDGKVIIWDQKEKSVKTFNPFDVNAYTNILSIAFQPGGNLLAVSSDIYSRTEKGHVFLYDYIAEKLVTTYDCGSFACLKVAWSPDGSRLAIASKSGQLQVIDVANKKVLWTIVRAHSSDITGLAWYPDSNRLLTSGIDRHLIQWNIDEQKVLRQISLPDMAIPISVALSPDGRFLLAGINNDQGNPFGLWNGETLQKLDFKPSGHTQAVDAVAFSTQGNRFATTSYDRAVFLWGFEPVDSPGTLLMNLSVPQVEAVSTNPAGKLMFIRNTGGGFVNVFTEDVEKPQQVRAPHAVLAFVWLDGRQELILGGYDGKISFVDPANGKELRAPVSAGNRQFSSLAVSADGRSLAAASCISSSACEQLALLNLETGQQQALKVDLSALRLPTTTSLTISSLAISPDGKTLAIGASTGKIVLYDLASGETRQPITEGFNLQNVTVASLAYSPAEQGLLIAGFKDGRIALWDTGTLGPVGEFVERLNGDVTGLLLRKNATTGLWTLVSASSRGEVREWEIDANAWVTHACQMVGRNLTAEEKTKFLLPGAPQEDFCPVKQKSP